MKQYSLAALALCGIVAFSMQGCMKDKCTRKMTYTKYEPVYRSLSDVRQPLEVQTPQPLKQPGKIYWYNNYVLISELSKGVHIYDISTPSSPTNIAFLKVEGNKDMAISNNVLYVDNYMDLLAINLGTNPADARIAKRLEDVFPTYGADDNGNLLVDYVGKEVTEDVECNSNRMTLEGDIRNQTMGATPTNSVTTFAGAQQGGSRAVSQGIGGAMARFTIARNHLYVVDDMSLRIFNITDAANPNYVNELSLGWGIETIFPNDNKLFIGSNVGMFIYSIADAANPVYVSEFRHAEACDPVFVDGDFAYVTLHDGTPCNTQTNELNVINIADINNPVLVQSYQVYRPHGLSIQGNTLYLCQAEQGVRSYNITDKNTITDHILFEDASFHAYDVIAAPQNNLLLAVGENGLHIFDRSSERLQRLSVINIER